MKDKKRSWGKIDEGNADASSNESTLRKMKENAEATGEGAKSPDMNPNAPEEETKKEKEPDKKGKNPKQGNP